MGRHRDDDDQSEDYSDQQNQQEKIEIRKPKIQRIDKFKTFKKIVINISMTQYPVVSEVAEELNWKIQTNNEAGDWDIYWTDFAIDPDILIKMHLFQKINHYPGIHVIARKNLLGMSLMGLRNRFPQQYNFFPLTWMLPLQYAEFRTYFESKPKGKTRTYIVKPEADCQGRGIFLTRKLQDLQNGKHYVVQRYLARPYLLDGLKFDLRIYVLLCGTNPLRLYMFEEGLARLATEQYTQPNSSNLQKNYIHLTNYAINKHNPKFIFNNNANNMGIGHKRSLTAVYKQLAAKGLNIEQLKAKINDVAIKTIICGLPLMSHQYKCSQPEQYSGNMCFHILGLDVMLNNKGEPILLQVNHTPSFTTDTPLDHKIKFNLIRDSLVLMNLNVQTKNQLFNKAKQLNNARLLTGKRQIFQGKERQAALQQAQRLRDQYEDKHLGGFTKIFPIKDQQKMAKYNEIIESANKTYFQENGSIRMKMMQKQAKKLVRSDFKQMKLDKALKETSKKSKNKETASQSGGISLTKKQQNPQNFNSQNLALSSTSKKSFQLQQKQEESIGHIQNLTHSQNIIDNKSQILIEPNLQKKLSERIQKEKRAQSTNRIRKYQSQDSNIPVKEQIFARDSRISNENKYSPAKRFYQKDQSAPYTPQCPVNQQSTSHHRQRIKSNIIPKPLSRKQYTKSNNQELPNIIDNLIGHNQLSSLLKKDQKSIGLTRNNPNQKIQSKSGKIYDHIARDIRQMIDKKSGGNGGYVMPKLINLSIENERRSTQHPPNLIPYRKGNINIFYSNNE